MVDGEVALRGGRFTRVDESRLLAETQSKLDQLAAQLTVSEGSLAARRLACGQGRYGCRAIQWRAISTRRQIQTRS